MEAKTHVSVCEVGSRGKIIASNNSDLGWGRGSLWSYLLPKRVQI